MKCANEALDAAYYECVADLKTEIVRPDMIYRMTWLPDGRKQEKLVTRDERFVRTDFRT